MGGHYFVSYSRVEAAEFATRLADRLVAGPPSYPVWLDVRDLQPGGDWDKQVRDAIQDSQGLLFVMTKDSVQDYSSCEQEWSWALNCKKPIIPLRVDPDAKLPFRLSARQYIDFTNGLEIGLAKLRDHFDWLGTPQGVLHDLRLRLADAERELPRAKDQARRARTERDIRDLRQRIAAQEKLVVDPGAAVAQTSQRIVTELEGEREPERPEPKGVARAKFVNAAPMSVPSYFQDRHVETELLVGFLRGDDARMATVVGRGGVGKTAMVCRLLKGLESGRLPDDPGELAVDGIVYLRTP